MDSTKRVVVVRHGHRRDQEDSSWALSSPTPWDPPLSAQGVNATRALAAQLGKEVQTGPIQVLCSPFLRCVQTALPIAQELNAKVRICSVFGEWMAPDYFEHGAPPNDNHASTVVSSYTWVFSQPTDSVGHVDFAWDTQVLGSSGTYGEDWTEMHDRVTNGLHNALRVSKSTLIIVTHGSVCNSLLAELREQPQMEEIPLASYASVERAPF